MMLMTAAVFASSLLKSLTTAPACRTSRGKGRPHASLVSSLPDRSSRPGRATPSATPRTAPSGPPSRGLGGTQLVISDGHTALKDAIGGVLIGASWQRCRVHVMRNILARWPKDNAEMVAAAVRTIFAQPDAEHAQLDVITGMLGRQFPQVEVMLRRPSRPAGLHRLPVAHCKKIWSTNPLERLNKEITRHTDVLGVFPNPEALLRLAGAALVEAHDEWQVSDRRYLSEGSMAAIRPTTSPAPALAAPAQLTA
jgi:putative transposase